MYHALADAGLFWMLIPKRYGGGGTDIVTAFKVIQEISRADGSTGWAFMANSCSAAVAAGFMNTEGGQEIFGEPNRGITAGMIVPTGTAVRVDGGYRVNSRYQFASGSAHASWIGAGFVVTDEDGNPILDANGEPDCRIAFLPREEIEFLGNWDVMGMVGTGSYDYAVHDRFVPDKYTMETFATDPTQEEPVFQLGLLGIGVGGHAPVALGLAQRALQEIAGIVSTKVRPGYEATSATRTSSSSTSPATRRSSGPRRPLSTRSSATPSLRGGRHRDHRGAAGPTAPGDDVGPGGRR